MSEESSLISENAALEGRLCAVMALAIGLMNALDPKSKISVEDFFSHEFKSAPIAEKTDRNLAVVAGSGTGAALLGGAFVSESLGLGLRVDSLDRTADG